ncbi:hypothetical protein EDC04DRAFT_3008541 [Pisolithus marmoratus]|nr:hypothetical protein EDC04DRAFT_3008541 [Pisolithus marmoratus]
MSWVSEANHNQKVILVFPKTPSHAWNGSQISHDQSIEPWYDGICRNHITCHCIIIEVIWYKKQNGVEHEFLQFNIFSPNKKHIAIVIAERAGNPTQPANTMIAPIDAMTGPIALLFTLPDLTGDSATSSDDEHSPPSAELEQMCNKATCICGLKSSENGGPSANELVTLLDVTSKHEPAYILINMQCYWFVANVRGTWNGLPICMKESLDEVCGKYCAAWAALLEEIELKHRVKHQQEDERQQEREQCQAAEEAAKWECKKCQAVEDEKQRECKKCQIAEDAAKVAEDEKQRECKKCQVAEERAQSAEEANAKLLLWLEEYDRHLCILLTYLTKLYVHFDEPGLLSSTATFVTMSHIAACHVSDLGNTVFTETFYWKEVMSGGGSDFEEHEKLPDSAPADEPLECPIKDECNMFFKLLRGPASEPAKKLQALWRYL